MKSQNHSYFSLTDFSGHKMKSQNHSYFSLIYYKYSSHFSGHKITVISVSQSQIVVVSLIDFK